MHKFLDRFLEPVIIVAVILAFGAFVLWALATILPAWGALAWRF